MPINPSDLLVGQITEDQIREFIHTPVSMRRDAFTVGSSDLDMTFQIPGDKLKAAMQWILGVDYVDNTNALRRSLPMFHPFWNWAWAKQVTVNGQLYDRDDTDSVVWDFQVTPAAWKKYQVEVSFDIPPFRMLEDDEIGSSPGAERFRFVSKFLSPETSIVTVDNGMVVYDANPTDGWNNEPHNTTIPVARRDGAGYRVVWHRVPADFIQPDDDTAPIKFMVAKGKVNNATLFGCPPETLLLYDVNMDDKYVCPLVTDQLGQLSFLYRIEFRFMFVKQLDGQIGKQLPTPETRRGHNLLLGPAMKYWYSRNKDSNKPVFELIDMNKLWTHWSDTYT